MPEEALTPVVLDKPQSPTLQNTNCAVARFDGSSSSNDRPSSSLSAAAQAVEALALGRTRGVEGGSKVQEVELV